jgi:hypothetical protein
MEIKKTDDAFAALVAGISDADLDSLEKEFEALVGGIPVNDLNNMQDEFVALFGEPKNISNNNNVDTVKKQCCEPVSQS